MPSPALASAVAFVVLTSNVPATGCASATAAVAITELPTVSTARNLMEGVALLTVRDVPTVPFVAEGSEPSVVYRTSFSPDPVSLLLRLTVTGPAGLLHEAGTQLIAPVRALSSAVDGEVPLRPARPAALLAANGLLARRARARVPG